MHLEYFTMYLTFEQAVSPHSTSHTSSSINHVTIVFYNEIYLYYLYILKRKNIYAQLLTARWQGISFTTAYIFKHLNFSFKTHNFWVLNGLLLLRSVNILVTYGYLYLIKI